MTIDPRKLRPSQAVQLLNSTVLGEVISVRLLLGHRSRAGFRIGDGKTIDLLRYAAWLRWEIEERREAASAAADAPILTGYDLHRERARQRNIEMSLSGRDIGGLPPVVNPERKARAESDFRFFCEQYTPQTFHLAWSPDHLKVIAKIELAVLEGGLFAMAMPRGAGKTSLCEVACLWALIYGHREFVALIGSDEEHAASMLDSIKVELETSERLLEDFPEVVFPIHALEGIHQRTGGQLYQGRPTYIEWTAKSIVLPTIPDSKASGAVIRVSGITGRIRGLKHKRADGSSVRPSLVLIDDPQTDESARSPSQCAARAAILNGAILGLAGPGRTIAGLLALTVVREDDLADRLLDRNQNPQWHGERTKMVYSFPKNEKLWTKYTELRTHAQRHDHPTTAAHEFYRDNRDRMDAGAVVAWPQRHQPDELSALQHAINLRMDRGEAAFHAEYQNEPLPEVAADPDMLTAEQIAAKVHGHCRGAVPAGATTLTMFIDVQQKCLFWLIAAWEEDFTGYVIDYGTEPDQKAEYFTLRDVKRTLATAVPHTGLEGSIFAGLERLCDKRLGAEYGCDDGAAMKIDRCLIDANWGQTTAVVKRFCRQSRFAGVVTPAHGRYVGASSIPFGDYRKKAGERVGLNWRVPIPQSGEVRHVAFDTNFWKSFIFARLGVAIGDPGCLSLFGQKPDAHRMLADHLTAEYRVRTEGRGRTVDEWKLRADGRDNHWLDCVVGAAVAASMAGVILPGTGEKKRPREVLVLSEIQAQRRAGR